MSKNQSKIKFSFLYKFKWYYEQIPLWPITGMNHDTMGNKFQTIQYGYLYFLVKNYQKLICFIP